MALRKRKAVFTAEPEQWARVEEMVRSGQYKSASAFLREAIDEKLARTRRARLAEQVARYCGAGHAEEDCDLIEWQAFDEEP
jgi:Arc/MetJ-type ribon-helix-helix transcriptional regulator